MDFSPFPSATVLAEPKRLYKLDFMEQCDARLRKMMVREVAKTVWTHQLNESTCGMKPGKFDELLVYEVWIKRKANIFDILRHFQRRVPHHLLLLVRYKDECHLTTAVKDPMVEGKDVAVVRDTVHGEWMPFGKQPVPFAPKAANLDELHAHIFDVLSDTPEVVRLSPERLSEIKVEIDEIKVELSRLQNLFRNTFNRSRRLELRHRILQLNQQCEALYDTLEENEQ